MLPVTLKAQPSVVPVDLDTVLRIAWVQQLRLSGFYENVLIGLVVVISLASLLTLVLVRFHAGDMLAG